MPRGIPNAPKPKHDQAPDVVTVVRAKSRTPKKEQEPARPVDKVLVRAKERGFYGYMIHNAGEVFEMDTVTMRTYPLAEGTTNRKGDVVGKEYPVPGVELVVIETPLGQFELPPWVELVDPDAVEEEELVPSGHKTVHGKFSPIVAGDVL